MQRLNALGGYKMASLRAKKADLIGLYEQGNVRRFLYQCKHKIFYDDCSRTLVSEEITKAEVQRTGSSR
jgi:hypothetical protein